MGIADFALRIDAEVKRLEGAVEARDERLSRGDTRQRWQRYLRSVSPDPESVTRIGFEPGGPEAGSIPDRGGRLWASTTQIVPEPDTQGRNHYDSNAVDAVIHPGVSAAEHGLVAEKTAQEAAVVGRIPCKRNAWRKVGPVRIVRILPACLLDRHVV